MAPCKRFPTHQDICDICKTNYFKKLRKNKIAYIPKLLEFLLGAYPDLKRLVAENSFDDDYLLGVLQKILIKMSKLLKRPGVTGRKEYFQTSLVSNFDLSQPLDSVKVEQKSREQTPETKLPEKESTSKKTSSHNGSETREFCVANIWAGFPTFGSIYSTSKLDIVQQFKDDKDKFIPAMLKILSKKYPRLKSLLSDSAVSDDYLTEILLNILRQAEAIVQGSSKQEKRQFFSTVFNIEILSNAPKQLLPNEKADQDIEDFPKGSLVSDIEKELSLLCPNVDSIEQSHLTAGCPQTTMEVNSENNVQNTAYLREYLKDLKSRYAWTQSELVEKSNIEKNLEKKLNYLLTKQNKYKCKIRRCRKEITEIDSFKSICRN